MKSVALLVTAVAALTLLSAAAPATKPVKLPLVVYADGMGEMPWIPSGWMGNTEAIVVNINSTEKPHTGKTCLRADYKSTAQWATVVWQSPANDWGDVDGGYNLTGAKKLTFWARGAKGGEKVKFGFGYLGPDKKFHDSAKGSTDEVLKAEWTQYTIDLKDQDLSKIKTGFYWAINAQSEPVTFYLDDILYE